MPSSSSGIRFGETRGQATFRVRNLANVPVTVTMRQVLSEAPPAGQTAIAGAPPLLLRGEINTTNLTFGYTTLNAVPQQSKQWSLEDEDLLNEALNLGILAYVLKENAVEDLVHAIRRVAEGKPFISASLSGMLLRRRAQSDALRRAKPGLDALTPTERRILRLIADDKTSKEIAEILGCAVRTVDTHRQNMSVKLELSGSHSLLKFAYDDKSRL